LTLTVILLLTLQLKADEPGEMGVVSLLDLSDTGERLTPAPELVGEAVVGAVVVAVVATAAVAFFAASTDLS
jgi:hypothetical protein